MALAPLIIPDPVRSDELQTRYKIDKGQAYHLWKSRQCSGQVWRQRLFLARADVEKMLAQRGQR